MVHTVRFVTGSHRSRQPSRTQIISFRIQLHSRRTIADHSDIQWSGFLATALTEYLPQRHSKRPFLMGSCLLPLKTRITGLSQSDSVSWHAVRESQVTVSSHSTTPLRRSLRMAHHISCFQFKDFGLKCSEKINGLRNRIMQEWSRYYINNFLLFTPKARAIKALTKTNRGQNGLASRSVLWPYNVMIFRFVPFSPLNSRAYIPCWKPSQQEWF